jgi:hypothetical protein
MNNPEHAPPSNNSVSAASGRALNVSGATPGRKKRIYACDRCGREMLEKSCKVVCPNCGNRFDCSDLNIYFD